MKFVVIQWPESQELFSYEGFLDHCHLICDQTGYDQFGDSAYFVDEEWFSSISQTRDND